MLRVALTLTLMLGAVVGCSPGESADDSLCPHPEHSVARVWNEAALDSIRRDFPAPTVHARNLFHLSVAMWDSWAALTPGATPYLSRVETWPSELGTSDRPVAVAFAAYRVLSERYREAVGGETSFEQFDELLAELCLDLGAVDDIGSAAHFGDRVGRAVLDEFRRDGAKESELYVAPFEVVNAPLVLADSGTKMADPNRWQQLVFTVAQTQNGQLLETNTQEYIGPHWGSVEPFALRSGADGLPLDPGPPPLLHTETEDAFHSGVLDVIRSSASLDPEDGTEVDISPGAIGNNPVGTDAGAGHEVNPATGLPYASNIVPAADYYRVIAEYWADGPDSETPPGHWNTIANAITDSLAAHRIQGSGAAVDLLQWDVSLYFALNGALHDAAIAAWGVKAAYDYARPISMVRHLGQTGDLLLERGLVEEITVESSQPGQAHAHLAEHVGESAIRTWAPEPLFFGDDLPSVRWIRAADWLPYQRPTFVTPAFPGYVSGHSTFSRAAAEVLAEITGDRYFPGGQATHLAPAGSLEFEAGPTVDVELQWATYFDAADEAGRSRIYGGIHVPADDYPARVMGAEIGQGAWQKATEYYSN